MLKWQEAAFRLIEDLREQECSWREVFWKLWGLVHVLLCSTCLGHFPACDLPLCRHHPEPPVFIQGRPSGTLASPLPSLLLTLHCAQIRPSAGATQTQLTLLCFQALSASCLKLSPRARGLNNVLNTMSA